MIVISVWFLFWKLKIKAVLAVCKIVFSDAGCVCVCEFALNKNIGEEESRAWE